MNVARKERHVLAGRRRGWQSGRKDEPASLHLMRTYGAHGGETQLARYFAAEPQGGIEETFAFVYPDPDCAALFERMRARVVRHDLLAVAAPPARERVGRGAGAAAAAAALQARFANLARDGPTSASCTACRRR